jgi:hypothetical protein
MNYSEVVFDVVYFHKGKRKGSQQYKNTVGYADPLLDAYRLRWLPHLQRTYAGDIVVRAFLYVSHVARALVDCDSTLMRCVYRVAVKYPLVLPIRCSRLVALARHATSMSRYVWHANATCACADLDLLSTMCWLTCPIPNYWKVLPSN